MSPKSEILEYIEKYLSIQRSKPLVIATPNPEQVVLAQKDRRFRQLLNQADVAIPDGIGLAWATGVPKIAGVAFMEELVSLAVRRAFPIALIGGLDSVAVAAIECLQARFPGLNGWACEPEECSIEEISKKLVATKTRLVFVGLGAPKQELLIARLARQLASQGSTLRTQGTTLLMSVGGSFDEIAGRVPRAPAAIDRIGLKWLWRLVHEPWRWKRQLALLKFLRLLATKGLTLGG